ncbi:ABC transporter substrate-binding protein [Sediminispirochaeta bajacaliforniensis]|uniref:ABC transporter substrate-binding protein n=1 Tax=Sediminispirochaeta bajacaliforniensis TaxID=148 RepID=UPI0003601D6E|nr:sugar ABC transporter substrate-binding protein [Sediminispirochaeta bajacaliforniensis]
MKRLCLVAMFALLCISFVIAGGKQERDGVVELEFWMRDTRPSNVEAMDLIVESFEQQHPGIKVNVVLTPWDSVEQKTMTAIAAGTLPDLSQLNQTGAADYGEKGILLNLDGELKSWDRLNDICGVSVSQAKYNGEFYAIPWFAGSNVMFYNKDLFIEAGIVDADGNAAPPKNWEEFLADAKKLTKDTDGDGVIDQWGFVTRGDVSLTIPIREFMLAAGDGEWVDSNRNVIVDSKKNLEGLNFYLDLFQRYKVVPPDTPSVDYVGEEQYFLSGKVAMMFNGPWNLGNMYDSSVNWGVALEPKREKNACHIGGCPVGIFNTTEHPQEALLFAKYLVSDEAQKIWAVDKGNGLPVTQKAQELAKQDPVIKVFVESLQAADADNVTPPPQIPEWVSIERSVAPPIFQSALLGEITPEACLAQLQSAMTAALNE